MSLEEKISIDNLYTDLSKISLTMSQSNKSSTIQPFGINRQNGGLMTKTTLIAINKVNK